MKSNKFDWKTPLIIVIGTLLLFYEMYSFMHYNHKFRAIGYHEESIVVVSDDNYAIGDKVYYDVNDFQTNVICPRTKFGMSDSCIIKSRIR